MVSFCFNHHNATWEFDQQCSPVTCTSLLIVFKTLVTNLANKRHDNNTERSIVWTISLAMQHFAYHKLVIILPQHNAFPELSQNPCSTIFLLFLVGKCSIFLIEHHWLRNSSFNKVFNDNLIGATLLDHKIYRLIFKRFCLLGLDLITSCKIPPKIKLK